MKDKLKKDFVLIDLDESVRIGDINSKYVQFDLNRGPHDVRAVYLRWHSDHGVQVRLSAHGIEVQREVAKAYKLID